MLRIIGTILIIINFILPARSQTSIYHPFPDNSAVWGMISGCLDNPCYDWAYIRNYISGDTLINGFVYRKINEDYLLMTSGTCCPIPGTLGAGYMREDTVLRKVFWRSNTIVNDTLLYDFNLTTGDTMQGYLAHCNAGLLVVQSIDSILIDNSYRRRINIDTSQSCSIFSIIEGIGSTNGLTACNYGNFEMGTTLHCFSLDSIIIYEAPCNADTIPCGILPSGFDEYEFNRIQIKIIPNPVVNSLKVIWNFPIIPLYGIFYNSLGQEVLKIDMSFQKNEFDVTNLPSGIYILKIESANNSVSTQKIVKL